ncbi:MAG: transposase [Microgenomates group bacterium]
MNDFYFKDKFFIPSIRLKNWDYSSSGFYFVTICTYQKQCFLGEIINGKMKLSKIGEIVYQEWINTKQIRKNIDLDEFIIMPNHLHGIIVIKNKLNVKINKYQFNVETSRRDVSTIKNIFKLKPNSLGSIIGQFKSKTTKKIHNLGYLNFHWQSRFWDHIIRNEKSLNEIRQYIKNNPLKWAEDEENPKNQQNHL